jgi:ribonuclease VapC
VNSVVLDASALLAYIQGEAGADRVESLLNEGKVDVLVSAVNLAETAGKLTRDGLQEEAIRADILGLGLEIVAFDVDQAFNTGTIVAQTASLGLSLGDRACLALAASKNAPAWTTDRAWKKLKTRVKVELLRN